MLTTESISPLKQNRKRNRNEEEDIPLPEMDLDELTTLKPISELPLDQLQTSQKIAIEQLKNTLFLSVDLGPEPSTKNPFSDMEADSIEKDSNHYASLLRFVTDLFLKQEPNPSVLSLHLEMTSRSGELLKCLSKSVNDIVIKEEDTKELARLIVFLLYETNEIIPYNLKFACQGILAINQASFGRKIEGTNIKCPNSIVKAMIRNVMLLLAPLSRQLLQFIVNFCCRFCHSEMKQRNLWARQLSCVFGFLLSRDSSNQPESWAILFFELLLHAHGLYTESHLKLEHREIWALDEPFLKELNARTKAVRTPMRRNRNMTTPRKSITRNGVLKTPMGNSLKRNLFQRKPPVDPPRPGFLATKDGKEFVHSPSNGDLRSVDRETYSKRLRVK